MPQDFLDEFTMLAAKFEKLAETTRAEEDNMPEVSSLNWADTRLYILSF